MKNILTLALCGSALIVSANAEKVRFEQLPTELRDKIRIHSGANPIEDIDRQTQAGKQFTKSHSRKMKPTPN